jgi:hypothetical protein
MQSQAQALSKAVAVFKVAHTAANARRAEHATAAETTSSIDPADTDTDRRRNIASIPAAGSIKRRSFARQGRAKRGSQSSRNTQKYRDDHVRFGKLAARIVEKSSTAEQTRAAAEELGLLLSELSGALKVHLAMEDSALYPLLAGSSDVRIQQLTARFQAEMGDLKQHFEGYAKKWSIPQNIAADPAGFAAETKTVFGALGNRIQRENNELYEAADALAA